MTRSDAWEQALGTRSEPSPQRAEPPKAPSEYRHRSSRRAPAAGPTHTSKRPDIQGLRTVAVVAVVINHLTGHPKGGFVGVDVFFVISGYLITGLLVREHDRTSSISFKGFYVRRIKRIVPAAALVLVATDIASFHYFPTSRFKDTIWDSLAAALFSGNWRFAYKSVDYFQQGRLPSPVQHFWSLGVEEQFYLVWPWLMLTVLAVGIGKLGWTQRLGRAVLAVCIGFITVATFAWAVHQSQTDIDFAYFSTFCRAWELGVGALLALISVSVSDRLLVLRSIASWVGLAGIMVSLFVVPSSHGFPAPWAALPVFSTALVIAAGHGATKVWIWPLTNRLSRYVGDISYSLYLWHWPVIVLLVAVTPSGTAKYYTVAVVVSVFLSMLSYHLVEDPIRTSKWLTSEATNTANWGGLVMLLATPVLAAGLVAFASDPVQDQGQTFTAAGQVVQTFCLGAQVLDPAHTCPINTSADSLSPTVDKAPDDTADAYTCWMPKKTAFKSCSYGSRSSDATRIALVGDSHAAMFLPALEPVLTKNNWRLDTYVGEGCQWMPAVWVRSYCTAMPDIQKHLIAGKYAMVLTSGARQKSANDKLAVSSAMVTAWTPVTRTGARVVAIADNPGVSEAAVECVQRAGLNPNRNDCDTSRSAAFKVVDPYVVAAHRGSGAGLIDLTKYYCTEADCPMIIGHEVVYRDTAAHLTATYARSVGPYLAANVRALMAR